MFSLSKRIIGYGETSIDGEVKARVLFESNPWHVLLLCKAEIRRAECLISEVRSV